MGQSQKVLSAVDLELIKSNPQKIFIVHKYTKDKNGEKTYLTHVTWAQEATFKTNTLKNILKQQPKLIKIPVAKL